MTSFSSNEIKLSWVYITKPKRLKSICRRKLRHRAYAPIERKWWSGIRSDNYRNYTVLRKLGIK